MQLRIGSGSLGREGHGRRERSVIVSLGLALSLTGCPASPTSSAGTDPPASPPIAAPAEQPQVTVAATPDGVRVELSSLPSGSQRAFAARGNVRRDAWVVQTADVTLQDDALQSAADFEAATLLLPPDPQEYDRTYPTVSRVGDGFVLYGPALALDGIDLQTDPPGLLDGYVYLGPDSEVEVRDGFRFVGRRSVAPWLGDEISKAANEALPYYTRMLGRPTKTPDLFITDDAPGPMSFHADVTGNAVVFLRLHGPDWQQADPRRAADVAKVVRHEAFHLWNRNRNPDTPPWLHEGGAEYAALIAAVTASVLTEDEAVERLSQHLARCRNALGDAPIGEAPTRGSPVYDCGVVVQWVADLSLRRRPDGRSNIFTVWRELVASDPETGYDLAQFRGLVDGPVELLFDASLDRATRWPALIDAVAPLGASLSTRPGDHDYVSAALEHLLAEHCGEGPRGYWTEPGFVRLDTSDACGPLAGQPELVGVGGHGLFEEPAAAFTALGKACARGRTIALQRRDGRDLKVACKHPLAEVKSIRIDAAPSVALDAPPAG